MEQSLVKDLETLAQETWQATNRPCGLRFVYSPNSVGPYGSDESRWQAVFERDGIGTCDYGVTLNEAAERLFLFGSNTSRLAAQKKSIPCPIPRRLRRGYSLARLRNPAGFPEPDDD
jgi:hypothetical protein